MKNVDFNMAVHKERFWRDKNKFDLNPFFYTILLWTLLQFIFLSYFAADFRNAKPTFHMYYINHVRPFIIQTYQCIQPFVTYFVTSMLLSHSKEEERKCKNLLLGDLQNRQNSTPFVTQYFNIFARSIMVDGMEMAMEEKEHDQETKQSVYEGTWTTDNYEVSQKSERQRVSLEFKVMLYARIF